MEIETYVVGWTDRFGVTMSTPHWKAYLSIPAAKRAANRLAEQPDIVFLEIVTAYREYGCPVVRCRRARNANGDWNSWEKVVV